MPVRLFREWLAYWQLEPFGGARDDLRAGLVAAVAANSAFGRAKGARTYKPSDFFGNLKDDDEPKAMTADAMERVAMAMTTRMGGKVLNRRTG